MLAYARVGQVRMTDPQLDDIFNGVGLKYQKIGGIPGNWNAPGTQAYFAYCDEYAILAFRGTEADDPEDCLYDGDILLVPEPDYRPSRNDPRPALGHLAQIMHIFAEPCLVHRGFQQALKTVWEEVHQAVASYRQAHRGSEICFTGHSLGAALAVLAYSRFADPDPSLFTYGCPRVGDTAFRNRVLSNPGRGIYRYVNYNDAVAHVPLESLLYQHSPLPCYRFDDNGTLAPDEGSFRGDVDALRMAVFGLPPTLHLDELDHIPAPPSVVDHSPARYCYRLWDCV